MRKKTLAQMKKELWKHFSLYIRKRDKGICFTCGRRCEGSGYQAGHFIPKSVGGLLLYFNEENVRGQCYHCNINLGGNQYIYGEKLGKETVEHLRSLQKIETKWTEDNYQVAINHYKDLCNLPT